MKDLHKIKEKTRRKINPLASELGISRKRLRRLVEGELECEDLTIREYELLAAHPIFSELMGEISLNGGSFEEEKRDFLAIYKITFYPEKYAMVLIHSTNI